MSPYRYRKFFKYSGLEMFLSTLNSSNIEIYIAAIVFIIAVCVNSFSIISILELDTQQTLYKNTGFANKCLNYSSNHYYKGIL